MTYEPRPLQVVVISQQVTLLHDISWILEAVGYKVQATNDFGQGGPLATVLNGGLRDC